MRSEADAPNDGAPLKRIVGRHEPGGAHENRGNNGVRLG